MEFMQKSNMLTSSGGNRDKVSDEELKKRVDELRKW